MAAKAKPPQQQLDSFLARFTPEIQKLAKAALPKMRKRFPTACELVYDNYNALAIGWSPTDRAGDVICSLALFPRWIHLFLFRATKLPDPDGWLEGSGKLVRHIQLASAQTLDEPAVQSLITATVAMAKRPLDPKAKRQLLIKSISAKQRPRRPA